MTKNYGIVFLIVAVVLVGLAIYSSYSGSGVETSTPIDSGTNTDIGSQPATSPNTNSGTTSKTIVVNYTDSGFDPRTIIINKGDTIRFTNNSSGRMWVASNPHPAHTIYPEFDEKTAVSTGATFDFTFTKIGNWDYHNHFKSTLGGTVVVK